MEKLLIVDGDRHAREALSDRFRKLGHQSVEAGSGWSCLQLVESEQVTQVVLHEKLPDMDGLLVLQIIMGNHSHLPVLFVLEGADIGNRALATQLGACEVLEKPLPMSRLVTALQECRARHGMPRPSSVAEILANPAPKRAAS